MLVWCDLETTGLDPRECQILEVAFVVTNDNLDIFGDTYQRLVHMRQVAPIDPVVQEMHTKNNLWEELRSGDNVLSPAQVSDEVCDFLATKVGNMKPPLCGSTVSFDRSFLQVHMPNTLKFVSHRHVDVSTIKELARRWRPEVEPSVKADAHRALPDIMASLNALRHYRRKGFIG